MFSECEPDYGNLAHCRCRGGLQPHGGLTPAAPGRGFANRQTMFEFRGRASGSPIHGGLTFAALFRRAFVHRRNRFFAGGRSHRSTRAGGVSPPWYVFGMRTRLRQSGALPLQTRFATPRRADARRSWLDVRLCIAKVVFSPADVRTPTRERGALAPRGMFSECEPDYGNPAHCRCRRGLQPHGGLTPAASGRMCVCASQKSFFRRRTFAPRNTRAGGVSPPWETKRAAD
jgi:hypothetical protein